MADKKETVKTENQKIAERLEKYLKENKNG
jgi:hypothetical protein